MPASGPNGRQAAVSKRPARSDHGHAPALAREINTRIRLRAGRLASIFRALSAVFVRPTAPT